MRKNKPINRCEKCIHWSRGPKNEPRFGACDSEKFVYTGRIDEPETPPTNDSFLYSDYEAYDASFETGPEFGCIHFERKK